MSRDRAPACDPWQLAEIPILGERLCPVMFGEDDERFGLSLSESRQRYPFSLNRSSPLHFSDARQTVLHG
ncbi:Hypothetical protein A7982_03250 [Minicystis rosea]|nr:Hypothetical protein A7982_03250 [Minicystis rosea]